MPEILITLVGGVTALTVAGGMIYRSIVLRKRIPPPPPSEYEIHKELYIKTGNAEELDLMEKDLEKEG